MSAVAVFVVPSLCRARLVTKKKASELLFGDWLAT